MEESPIITNLFCLCNYYVFATTLLFATPCLWQGTCWEPCTKRPFMNVVSDRDQFKMLCSLSVQVIWFKYKIFIFQSQVYCVRKVHYSLLTLVSTYTSAPSHVHHRVLLNLSTIVISYTWLKHFVSDLITHLRKLPEKIQSFSTHALHLFLLTPYEMLQL